LIRIGFDAKRAFHNYTGLGNYSRTLIRSLADSKENHQLFLYTPPYEEDPLKGIIKPHGNVHIRKPAALTPKMLSFLWRSFFLTKNLIRDGVQLFHGLSHELPYGIHRTKIKTVVTIHDLIFIRYPGLFPWLDRKVYFQKFKYSCEYADRIIAISRQTKEDILQTFDIPESKVEVLYQSCSPIYYGRQSELQINNVKTEYGLPEEYILYVGAIDERKNLIALLKAIYLLRLQKQRNVSVVVVGVGKAYKNSMLEYVKKKRLQDLVQFLGDVPDYKLTSLYQAASVFVYPSLFEGFGLPVSEALFSRTPVITSKGSCFSEAGGPKTIYVDPQREWDLAMAILRVLKRPDLRKEMIETGYQYAQRFHEKEVSRNLINLYQEVLNSV